MTKTLKTCCCVISVFILHGCEAPQSETADETLPTSFESNYVEEELVSDEISQIDIDLAARYTLGTAERAELVTFNSITETDEGHTLNFTTWKQEVVNVRTQSSWDPVNGGMTSGWETELDYFDSVPNDREFLLVYLIQDETTDDNIIRLLAEATHKEIKAGNHGEIICQSPGVADRKF